TLAHTRGHLVRSIMEGVTYALRDSLEIIQNLGVPVSQIRASGGGSRSPFWRQIQADVFGQKVSTINAEQGTAYGVALLSSVGAGAYNDVVEASDATIRVVKEPLANRKAVATYHTAFPIYQSLSPALKDRFAAIAEHHYVR